MPLLLQKENGLSVETTLNLNSGFVEANFCVSECLFKYQRSLVPKNSKCSDLIILPWQKKFCSSIFVVNLEKLPRGVQKPEENNCLDQWGCGKAFTTNMTNGFVCMTFSWSVVTFNTTRFYSPNLLLIISCQLTQSL